MKLKSKLIQLDNHQKRKTLKSNFCTIFYLFLEGGILHNQNG
jgi:hypothetical protein